MPALDLFATQDGWVGDRRGAGHLVAMISVRRVLAVATTIGGLLLGACSVFGVRSGTEEPHFTVVDRLGGTEIRQYDARLVAETNLAGQAGAARSEGFTRLAGYIFGGNARRDRIAMTAPVAQARAVEGSVVRFFLPTGLSEPPHPNDDRVRIVTVPAETIAVRRYTGSISDPAIAAQAQALLSSLPGTRWAKVGEPVAWFYDPPWTLPPLRRNEVAVTVIDAGAAAPDSARDFKR